MVSLYHRMKYICAVTRCSVVCLYPSKCCNIVDCLVLFVISCPLVSRIRFVLWFYLITYVIWPPQVLSLLRQLWCIIGSPDIRGQSSLCYSFSLDWIWKYFPVFKYLVCSLCALHELVVCRFSNAFGVHIRKLGGRRSGHKTFVPYNKRQ